MADIEPEPRRLIRAITEVLGDVVDPETGTNVLELGLVRDIRAEDGHVRLTLRPASSVCPVAFTLGLQVSEAISTVPGVGKLTLKVSNHKRAEEIERLLNEGRAQKGAE